METSITGIIHQLCNSKRLERDQASLDLEKLLTGIKASEASDCLQKRIISILSSPDESWESKHGCLLAAKILVLHLQPSEKLFAQILLQLKNEALKLLKDSDYNVRLAAGDLLGCLTRKFVNDMYPDVKETVLKLISNSLEVVVENQDWSDALEQTETDRIMDKMSGTLYKRRSGADISQTVNESPDWKNLETNLRCLDCLIQGCGTHFNKFIDDRFLSLVSKVVSHPSHSVRHMGFQLCTSLFKAIRVATGSEINGWCLKLGFELGQHLANGLSDNWSQVRLSASVSTRVFLLLLNNETRLVFYPLLLPRMCLNRYFFADGVRIYSQETWRQVTGATGKDLVERYIGPTINFYHDSMQSENYGIREAACSCISELTTQMPSSLLSPFIDSLLVTLKKCLRDETWPVRYAACLACGNIMSHFPEESRGSLSHLYPLLYRNLGDRYGSVRQGAAIAIGNLLRAYGDSRLVEILLDVENGLKGMHMQGSSHLWSVTTSPKHYGDFQQEVVSAKPDTGESAPTIKQPWQLADGCIHLITELSHNKDTHCHLVGVLPLVKEATKYKNYGEYVTLLETLCRQLPCIAKNLGKRPFSSLVDHFLDALFDALNCENGPTSSAASQCLNALATFLGEQFLRTKINSHNPSYADAFESVIFSAPF